MWFLYILLIIIAVGVLLASEAGQGFLRQLLILGGIIGLLYLGFWLVVFAIGLFSTNNGVFWLCGIGLLVFIGSYWKKITSITKSSFKNWLKEHQSFIILFSILFIAIAIIGMIFE